MNYLSLRNAIFLKYMLIPLWEQWMESTLIGNQGRQVVMHSRSLRPRSISLAQYRARMLKCLSLSFLTRALTGLMSLYSMKKRLQSDQELELLPRYLGKYLLKKSYLQAAQLFSRISSSQSSLVILGILTTSTGESSLTLQPIWIIYPLQKCYRTLMGWLRQCTSRTFSRQQIFQMAKIWSSWYSKADFTLCTQTSDCISYFFMLSFTCSTDSLIFCTSLFVLSKFQRICCTSFMTFQNISSSFLSQSDLRPFSAQKSIVVLESLIWSKRHSKLSKNLLSSSVQKFWVTRLMKC